MQNPWHFSHMQQSRKNFVIDSNDWKLNRFIQYKIKKSNNIKRKKRDDRLLIIVMMNVTIGFVLPNSLDSCLFVIANTHSYLQFDQVTSSYFILFLKLSSHISLIFNPLTNQSLHHSTLFPCTYGIWYLEYLVIESKINLPKKVCGIHSRY